MNAEERMGGAVAVPIRPDWSLIVCRTCGRRMFDNDGNDIHRGWLYWLCWLIPRSGRRS